MNGAARASEDANGFFPNGINGINGGAARDMYVKGGETFFSTQQKEPLTPKRIIICCDGSWQDAETLGAYSGVCATNVARLSNVLARGGEDEDGKVWPQVVYYQSGVGTGQEDLATKMMQGGMGIGLLENVIRAYNFIVNNYNHGDRARGIEGDKIYMFGFSRGAYTARALAGLVCGIGVLKPTAMPEFRRQYYNYIRRRNFRTPFHNTMSWVNFLNMEPDPVACRDVKIEIVGVWDTVGALGIPDMGHFWRLDLSVLRRAVQFYDTDLHPNIQNAFHALALDECRDTFKPTLWTKKTDSRTNLIQCWFPGAHVNVGGGMQFEADETLAYVSYAWMLDRIRPHLALNEDILEQQMKEMYFAAELRNKYRLQSRGFLLDGLSYVKSFALGPSALPVTEGIDPVAAPIDRSTDWMFNLITWNNARTPKQYHRPEAGDETCEYIHHSVICRYLYSIEHGHMTYIPAALRNWTRVLEEKTDGDWRVVTDSGPNRRDSRAPRRHRWYKYKTDLLGNPVSDGKGVPIVENYLDELPVPTNGIDDMNQRPLNGSIETYLYHKSWSKLYADKVGNVRFSPGLLAMLPTGLHSIIVPELHRYFSPRLPISLSTGAPLEGRIDPRAKTDLMIMDSSAVGEVESGKRNKSKKGNKALPDDLVSSTAVAIS